jgi:hypothetical protein
LILSILLSLRVISVLQLIYFTVFQSFSLVITPAFISGAFSGSAQAVLGSSFLSPIQNIDFTPSIGFERNSTAFAMNESFELSKYQKNQNSVAMILAAKAGTQAVLRVSANFVFFSAAFAFDSASLVLSSSGFASGVAQGAVGLVQGAV